MAGLIAFKKLILNLIDFADFDDDVAEIFGRIDDLRVDPKVPLDAVALIRLDSSLIDVAQYLLRGAEMSISELSEKIDQPENIVGEKLHLLFAQGYIGRYNKTGKVFYFIR